jgi:hypothetical protein
MRASERSRAAMTGIHSFETETRAGQLANCQPLTPAGGAGCMAEPVAAVCTRARATAAMFTGALLLMVSLNCAQSDNELPRHQYP